MEKEYSKHTPYLVFIGLFSVLALFISTFKRAYSFYTAIVSTSTFNITAQQSFAILDVGQNVRNNIQFAVSDACSKSESYDEYLCEDEGVPLTIYTNNAYAINSALLLPKS